ncbi:MurR/RpiR family transcriptional regulator [Plesiomonas shigelloides subsp. oncorhynchi]|nr:MurR/RpiR family transcriptional regulator [Plesiomonas shigelloides]
MDNLINKVKTLLHSTNQNEQKISRFIVEQQFDLSELSATKVGMLLGISDSSVIRYAKSLGCSGFPDLKLKLAVQAPHALENTDQAVYASIEASDSTAQIIEKSKHLFISTIEQSLGLIDADMVEQCAQQLLNASKITLAGIGASAIVAADINHKLIRAGFNVQFNQDYHIQIVQASLLKVNDVLLVVSARGNTQEVITAIERAKQHGAKVIALTRYGRDKVAQLADIVIPYSYTEKHLQLGMVTPNCYKWPPLILSFSS